jgi:CheY-like chemotaxis protein
MHAQCKQDAPADSATARILIVDDEPSVHKVFVTLLSQAGVSCSAAPTPQVSRLEKVAD